MLQIYLKLIQKPFLNSPHFLKKGLAYLKAGHLLHIISILFLVPGYFLAVHTLLLITNENWLSGIFIGWLSSFCLTNSVLAQLDARSRWQNYKQLKDQLFEKGFRALILKPVLKSRCQRDAALIAASELGYKAQVKAFFYRKGYRWYHVFPDFVFTHPQFLFSAYFWKTTFFAKHYQSKFF